LRTLVSPWTPRCDLFIFLTFWGKPSKPAILCTEEWHDKRRFQKAQMATILVIDDDARDRELLSTVLEERGYDVIVADNGGTGLMLCHRRNPDAVVLDLHMPGIDGRSLLQQLRTLHPSLPVVVFSGHRTEEVEQEMLNKGATAFIQKAFSLHQLGLALQEVLPSPTKADG
jgi:two-component system, OmpR family, response regulator